MSDAIRPDQGSQGVTAGAACNTSDCIGVAVATVPLYRLRGWPEAWRDEHNSREVPVCQLHKQRAERINTEPEEPGVGGTEEIEPEPVRAECAAPVFGQPEADPGIVAEAVTALRAFGGDLTPADAMKLLPMWHYFRRLTPAEVNAILRHFTGGAR